MKSEPTTGAPEALHGEAAPELPRAIVAPEAGRSWAWLLPVGALGLAIFLAWQTWSRRGALVVVHAAQGYGIQAGDPLRYRGITVGELVRVELEPDLTRVRLDVRLAPSASELAREGSRFWIVRPHLSLDGVQGLETVVGARYLSVLPGASGGARRRAFVALEEPPVPESVDPAGLELVIESPARFGLAPGAAIDYRGVRVGTLLDVALASDSTSVELHAYIRPPFVTLVRDTTRFWETGGLEVDLGWVRGLKIELDSLRSLLVGGLSMATPPEGGAPVTSGRRFTLSLDPQPEWLEWRPALPVGAGGDLAGLERPRLVRAELAWKQGRLWASERTRLGWLLPIPGGLLGPADLLRPVERARGDGAVLSIGAEHVPLRDEPAAQAGGLAVLSFVSPEHAAWPASRLAGPDETGDCLVIADPSLPPAALSAARLVADERGWRLDGGPRFDPSWHGAAVVRRGDGRLVGILLLDGKAWRIARPSAEWW